MSTSGNMGMTVELLIPSWTRAVPHSRTMGHLDQSAVSVRYELAGHVQVFETYGYLAV
jgi:hypothetical protein